MKTSSKNIAPRLSSLYAPCKKMSTTAHKVDPAAVELFNETLRCMIHKHTDRLMECRRESKEKEGLISELTIHILNHIVKSHKWYISALLHLEGCSLCKSDVTALDLLSYCFANIVAGLSTLGIEYDHSMRIFVSQYDLQVFSAHTSFIAQEVTEYIELAMSWARESSRVSCEELRSIEYA